MHLSTKSWPVHQRRGGFLNYLDHDCTPEQTRSFDSSYNEVKEIALTLYAHFEGSPAYVFPAGRIDQLIVFFGVVADEVDRDFGIVKLSRWHAMKTKQPCLIVDGEMAIGKEFLLAGSVRSIMWLEESSWHDSCSNTKGFFFFRYVSLS